MVMAKIGFYFRLTVGLTVFFFQTNTFGYDITNKFSIGGVLAGAWQYLDVDDNIQGVDDGPKAAVAFQPVASA